MANPGVTPEYRVISWLIWVGPQESMTDPVGTRVHG